MEEVCHYSAESSTKNREPHKVTVNTITQKLSNQQYIIQLIDPEKSACYTAICFFTLQVVLTVSQTMWARDVTEVLENTGDRLEAMKEFEQTNIKVSLFID